jgi:hypothetical protein
MACVRLIRLRVQRKFHFFNCFFFKKLLTEESTMRRCVLAGRHTSCLAT